MVVAKEELETPRNAAEMLDWVNEALGRFNSKELKAEAREGKNFAKELTDEALPIALFAKGYYEASADVTITHVIGSQQYDATVEDRRQKPSAVAFIEATVSDRNYTEALRMEILNRDRSVAAYGEVQAEGRKGRRTKLEAKSMAVKHDDIRAQHIEAVIDAVGKKAKIKYPNNTALVVRIDDAVPFREEADVAALEEIVHSALIPMLADREFRVLSLVGSQGLHLSYSL